MDSPPVKSRRPVIAAVVVVALAVVGVSVWKVREDGKPAPHSDELELCVVTEHRDGSRFIHMTIAGGEAVLELKDDPRIDDDNVSHGKGTLTAPNRDSGAKFVAALAEWEMQAVPQPRADQLPLEPIPIDYSIVQEANADRPERTKLYFVAAGLRAEIYLLLFPGGQRATFATGNAHDENLVQILAIVLRDGVQKARKPGTAPDADTDARSPMR